ncbi:MAG: FAD-dependent oxidoreductase, partial [Myxococcota bacterium]
LARGLGVDFHHETDVHTITLRRGKVVGVMSERGHHPAEIVVFNGDISALAQGLLGRGAARGNSETPRDGRSLSAVTWAMEAQPEGVELLHHNVFFSANYPAEFDSLLRHGRVPTEPTVYICAQDRAEESLGTTPELERLLVLVNAPPNGDEPHRWGEAERTQCTIAMANILRRAGLRLKSEASIQTTPVEFHRLFPATGGALYGPRSKGSRSVLARTGASTRVRGLYLAGGSVHPGAGVPMAALSGRLAAERILEDQGLTGRFRRAATSGTT